MFLCVLYQVKTFLIKTSQNQQTFNFQLFREPLVVLREFNVTVENSTSKLTFQPYIGGGSKLHS
jgi:hypothetical protein